MSISLSTEAVKSTCSFNPCLSLSLPRSIPLPLPFTTVLCILFFLPPHFLLLYSTCFPLPQLSSVYPNLWLAPWFYPIKPFLHVTLPLPYNPHPLQYNISTKPPRHVRNKFSDTSCWSQEPDLIQSQTEPSSLSHPIRRDTLYSTDVLYSRGRNSASY